MIVQRSFVALLAFAVVGLGFAQPSPVAASEAPGWYFEADLGAVWTGGNSESNALGAAAELRRTWPQWRLVFSGSASQTETTTKSRFATGTEDDYDVEEISTSEKTSEFYNARAAAARDISEHFFILGGVDWMRNRPAGIDSRTLLALGAGNTWFDLETRSLRTYYNFTYTFEDDVVKNDLTPQDYPGLQAGYDYSQQITANAKFESDAIVDFNLDNTDDIRVNWFGALPVSMSSRLELKPSLRVMWRNDPALEEIPVVGGVDDGTIVTTPLSKWDTIFTLALVVKFGPDSEG